MIYVASKEILVGEPAFYSYVRCNIVLTNGTQVECPMLLLDVNCVIYAICMNPLFVGVHLFQTSTVQYIICDTNLILNLQQCTTLQGCNRRSG